MTSEKLRDFAALGEEWMTLEARARFSVFQGWGWVGCLAVERYDDPIVLRAQIGGRLVGLALFNRSGRFLHLHESGDPARDRPFIEHNGPLLAHDAPTDTATALMRCAWTAARGKGLRLSGVSAALLDAAGGVAWRRQLRPSPCIDLCKMGAEWLSTISANTRQQLRRSERSYREQGELRIEAATSSEAVDAALNELMTLHDLRWEEKGAFATPFLHRFHKTLCTRLMVRNELDLLRVTAGDALVGLLYNFRREGRVMAYQSGWVDPKGDARRKPGLTCHHQAILLAIRRGDRHYDFLAGGQRYKTSLARGGEDLHWAEMVRPTSWRGVLAQLRNYRSRHSAT